MGKILWLTGEAGAGKTTVAKEIQKTWPCIILDGDEMRECVSLGLGYISREDRTENYLRIARLAKVLSRQTNVVISVIAAVEEARRKIDEICNPCWIYVKRTMPKREGHFYDKITKYSLLLDHDKLNIKQSVLLLKQWMEGNKIC